MNVYDSAHSLSKAIKESEVYKDYTDAKKNLEADKSLNESFLDFKKREADLRVSILSGKEPDENEIETLNKLFGVLSKDPLCSEYFSAEGRYRQLLDDLSKILAEAMQI